MDNEILKWIGGVATSVSITGIIGYLWRDSLGRFMTKSVEHRFDKRIETFKAGIREGERELEHIRNYLSSASSGRDAALQAKRFEAADNLMKARQFLNKFAMAVQYMQILNIDEFFKRNNDPKLQGFIDAIVTPLKIDERFEEYNQLDINGPRLYLNERTIQAFDIYESIIVHAVATLRMVQIAAPNTSDIITSESISKKIVNYVPWAKESFERHGDKYIYYWREYFNNEILKELRNELIGETTMERDTQQATKIAMGLREVQINLHESLGKYGLSDDLINKDVIDKVK